MFTEKWSIEYNEVVEFMKECGFEESCNVFLRDEVQVRILEKGYRKYESLEFPEIHIEFSGDEAKLSKFHDSFKLRFFRAGG